MSAQYDLYETPDPDCTGEQKPLHARIAVSYTHLTLPTKLEV